MRKFIIVEDPEQIDDEDFNRFLAGRKRVALKEADLAGLLEIVKYHVKEGIVTVDTAISQQTAMKKVRMIRMVDDATLRTILESIHSNAKKQAELIRWMIEHANETISAKQLMEQTGIQSSVLKAVIDRGAAVEEFAEVYREPDAPELKDTAIPDAFDGRTD